MQKAKKKGFPFFWLFYLLFVAVMVGFWFYAVSYVKKCLVTYEESQPGVTMDAILAEFREKGLDDYMRIEGEVSRFETQEVYASEFQSRVKGKILFADPSRGVQNPASPRYDLFANGEKVGIVTLKETSSEPFFLHLLTISQWVLDKVEMESIKAENAVEVTIPEHYVVKVNGIAMDERELTQDAEVSSEFTYAADYVEVPSFVTYRTEGLLEVPVVEIFDPNGNPVNVEVKTNGTLTSASLKEFGESEMPADLEAMVLEQTERYTNFFSVDLPGCRNSVSPIKDMFPADSYYLSLADTYRREDMWMYSSHDAPKFKNEKVSHYVRYTEDLFSCEVYFDKEMLLHKTGKVKVDTTNFKLYYGNLDGEWKILDIVTLLSGQEG